MTHKEIVLFWGFIAILAFILVLAFEAWFYSRVKRKKNPAATQVRVPQDHDVVHIIEQVRLPRDWEQEDWLDDEPVFHDWNEEGWA